jgi:hypothetical protein
MVPSEQLPSGMLPELPESWKTEPGLQDPTDQARAYPRPLDQESLPPILKHNLSVDGMMAMGWNHYRHSLKAIHDSTRGFWRVALSWFLGEFERAACELGWGTTIDCEFSKIASDGTLYTLCWYVEGAVNAYHFYHDQELILQEWRADKFTLERAHAHVTFQAPSRDEQELPCRACSKVIGPDGYALDGFLATAFVACSKSCGHVAVRREFEQHPELNRLYRANPGQYDHFIRGGPDNTIKSWLLSLPCEPYIRRAVRTIPACSFCGRELECITVTGEPSKEPCAYCGCRKWWLADLPPAERMTVETKPRFRPKIKRKSNGQT